MFARALPLTAPGIAARTGLVAAAESAETNFALWFRLRHCDAMRIAGAWGSVAESLLLVLLWGVGNSN